MWVIKGSKEYLIPYIADVVKEVDVENKKLSSRHGRIVGLMKIDYLTLFPEMFDGVLNHSIMKRAQENNKLQINTVNFRDYAINKHNQVDDYPYGGGQGMVLKPEPVLMRWKT